METKTIKVLRKFYINGVVQEIGKIIKVSSSDAKVWIGNNKAEYAPEPPEPPIEEEVKKEEPKSEIPEIEEVSSKTKKGGTKNVSI